MKPALTSLPSNSTIYPPAEFSFIALFQLILSSSVPAFGKCHILTVGFFFWECVGLVYVLCLELFAGAVLLLRNQANLF